jgi:mono/diheme cytochrome c family protein
MIKQTVILLTLTWLAVPAFAQQPDGKKLFQENCAICHGDHAQGKIGPKLVGDSSKWSNRLFERGVLHGIDDENKKLKPPMPVWQNSSFKSDAGQPPSKQEVDAIHHYLQTL